MKALEYFLSIDTLGPIPAISNQGNSRYVSIPGAILSIFVYILVLIIYRQDIEDVFRETNPRVYSERKPLNDAIKFDSPISSLFFYEIKYIDTETLTVKTIIRENYPKVEIGFVHFNSSVYNYNSIPHVEKNNTRTYLESCIQNPIFNDFNKHLTNIILTSEQIKVKQANSLCYPAHIDKSIKSSLEDNYSIVVFFDYKDLMNLIKIYKTNLLMVVINSLEINLTPNDSNEPYKLLWKDDWMSVEMEKTRMMYVQLETFKGNKDLTKFVISPDTPITTHYFVEKVEERIIYDNYHMVPEQYYFLDSPLIIMLMNNQRITEEFLYYKSFDGVLGNI